MGQKICVIRVICSFFMNVEHRTLYLSVPYEFSTIGSQYTSLMLSIQKVRSGVPM